MTFFGQQWSRLHLPKVLLLAAVAQVSAAYAALDARQTSPTEVCRRWAHQSQVVNGTLYIYGGRAVQSPEQSTNQWNNDFLSIDLTESWQITSPSFKGYPQPSGPPAVSLGYLWASYDSLFLYGGEFSDSPPVNPTSMSTWEYHIASGNWEEHTNPSTSSGTNAASDGEDVERAAEGAGFSVPSLGRGWYFGGHEDGYTVQGWSQSIPRIYLTSLLEFTMPGYSNQQVLTLSDGSVASSEGAYRNITEGALTNTAGFPERADGVLVYIPGFGDEGILLGLGGGTNQSFTQMNIIDVFDIATSKWYKQATSGSTPKPRVNPCAVVAAAADGSSYQVYMFSGQNLIPAGEQIQYTDMWVLSVPSFTWMEVDQTNQAVPPGRSGHTCNIWDGQMVVVGGYVGDLSCDSPGVYIFNTSSLEWQNNFNAMSNHGKNPLSQQESQAGKSSGLIGSYGYQVPSEVQSAIGGGPSGGASVTSPQATATEGPLASGTPPSYPVQGGTSSDSGSGSESGGGSNNSSGGGSSDDDGPNVAAIAAGVVAGIAVLVAVYLAFVAYLYRKRMRQYKENVDRFGWAPSKEASSTETSRGREGRGYLPVSHRRTSSTDLLGNKEPTFIGIALHPRRSLRVTNPD